MGHLQHQDEMQIYDDIVRTSHLLFIIQSYYYAIPIINFPFYIMILAMKLFWNIHWDLNYRLTKYKLGKKFSLILVGMWTNLKCYFNESWCLFFNLTPITMVYQRNRSIIIVSVLNGGKTPAQNNVIYIGSPPFRNGTDLFSKLIHFQFTWKFWPVQKFWYTYIPMLCIYTYLS